MDIAAARKVYEAALKEPWTLRRDGPDVTVISGQTVIAEMGDFYPEADFVAQARTGWPAALDALEEAQGKLNAIRDELAALGLDLDGDFDSADDVIDVVGAHERELNAILKEEV